MIGLLWRLSQGHLLRPWKSPLLRWRIETYWGLHADRMTDAEFRKFVWQHRGELLRFLRWAGRMRQRAKSSGGRPFTLPS